MASHEWRASLMEGRQDITITGDGFRVTSGSFRWADLTEVRTFEMSGKTRAERLVLSLGAQVVELKAMGADRDFAPWNAMIADFAARLAQARPEMEMVLSPSVKDLRVAFGFGAVFLVGGVLVTTLILSSGGVLIGALAGVMPALAGGVICAVYWPGRPEKRASATTFAALRAAGR